MRPRAPYCPSCLFRRALVVATTNFPKIPLAPAPSALLPPPYLRSFEYLNGVILPSIGSFESYSEAEAPNAHVGHDREIA